MNISTHGIGKGLMIFYSSLAMMLCLASCQTDTIRRSDYAVEGIDVSHYQSTIDWDSLSMDSFQFIFMKASEGLELKDSFFLRNWKNAKHAGLIRGAYHFFRPTLDSYTQFLNFSEHVRLDSGDLPPVLDIEVYDGVDRTDILQRAKLWLQLAESHYGVKPIIYTNQRFYHKVLKGHVDDYPLWIARYNEKNSPWLGMNNEWSFWQYGNKGFVHGIEGYVDLNVFRGSLEDLKTLCIEKESHLFTSTFQRYN